MTEDRGISEAFICLTDAEEAALVGDCHYLDYSMKGKKTIVEEGLFHRRMQHCSERYIRKAAASAMNIALTKKLPSSKTYTEECTCCALGKMKRKPVSNQAKAIPDTAGDIVYVDLMALDGPDRDKNVKCLVMVDGATRMISVEPMKGKEGDDVLRALQACAADLQRKIGAEFRIRKIQPDSEKVLVETAEVVEWAQLKDYVILPSPPYKKDRNGVVERKIGQLKTRMRCMEKDLGVNQGYFGGQCAQAAAYGINLTPTSTLAMLSPYTRACGKPPPLHQLKVWGCKVLVKDHKHLTAMQNRSMEGIFVNYGNHATINTYKVFLPSTNSYVHSEDCIFHEDETIELEHTSKVERKAAASDDDWIPTEVIPSTAKRSRPKRLKKKRRRFDVGEAVQLDVKAFYGHVNRGERSYPGVVTRVISGNRYEVDMTNSTETHIVDGKFLSSNSKVFVVRDELLKTTMNYRQAMRSPYRDEFRAAMVREWNNLLVTFGVLSEPIPEGEVPADAQKLHMLWRFEYKPEREGEKRFRARCLARGDEEREKYNPITYSATATKESLRILLHMAVQRDWEIYAADISNAFLNTDMTDVKEGVDTYLHLPPGPMHRRGYVVKKLKNIYGMATAPLLWSKDLKMRLRKLGFVATETDECLFLKKNSKGKVIMGLTVHVDDLMIVGARKNIDKFLDDLEESGLELRRLGYKPAS